MHVRTGSSFLQICWTASRSFPQSGQIPLNARFFSGFEKGHIIDTAFLGDYSIIWILDRVKFHLCVLTIYDTRSKWPWRHDSKACYSLIWLSVAKQQEWREIATIKRFEASFSILNETCLPLHLINHSSTELQCHQLLETLCSFFSSHPAAGHRWIQGYVMKASVQRSVEDLRFLRSVVYWNRVHRRTVCILY